MKVVFNESCIGCFFKIIVMSKAINTCQYSSWSKQMELFTYNGINIYVCNWLNQHAIQQFLVKPVVIGSFSFLWRTSYNIYQKSFSFLEQDIESMEATTLLHYLWNHRLKYWLSGSRWAPSALDGSANQPSFHDWFETINNSISGIIYGVAVTVREEEGNR